MAGGGGGCPGDFEYGSDGFQVGWRSVVAKSV